MKSRTAAPQQEVSGRGGLRIVQAVLATAAAGMLVACGTAETGSVTLRWTAPTENEDGTSLQNLAGYRIYWRESGEPVEHVVVITDPTATSYEIDRLANGRWHAGVAVFTEDDLESDLATVSFTIEDGVTRIDESTFGRVASRAAFADPVAARVPHAED
jgi:hypothetical protein